MADEQEPGAGLRAWREYQECEPGNEPASLMRTIESALRREAASAEREGALVAAAVGMAAQEIARTAQSVEVHIGTAGETANDAAVVRTLDGLCVRVARLTPADAQASLDAMLERAREEGREAALEEVNDWALVTAKTSPLIAQARAEGHAAGLAECEAKIGVRPDDKQWFNRMLEECERDLWAGLDHSRDNAPGRIKLAKEAFDRLVRSTKRFAYLAETARAEGHAAGLAEGIEEAAKFVESCAEDDLDEYAIAIRIRARGRR